MPTAVGAATRSITIEDAVNPANKAAVSGGKLKVDTGLGNYGGIGFRTAIGCESRVGTVAFTTAGTEQLTFPAGLPLKSGHKLSAIYGVASAFFISVSGYQVPASACTTGLACGY